MTPAAKKTATKKTAPKKTGTPKAGAKKAAFQVTEAVKPAKVRKHHLSEAIRAALIAIAKDLPEIVETVNDAVIYTAQYGLLGGLNETIKNTSTPETWSYNLNRLFMIMAKYRWDKTEPAISKEDSTEIIDCVEYCFDVSALDDWTDKNNTDLSFTAMVCTSAIIAKAKAGRDIYSRDTIETLKLVEKLEALATAVYEQNQPERSKKAAAKTAADNAKLAEINFNEYPTLPEDAKNALLWRVAKNTIADSDGKVKLYTTSPHIHCIQCSSEIEAADVADLLKRHFTDFAAHVESRPIKRKPEEIKDMVYSYCYENKITSYKQ